MFRKRDLSIEHENFAPSMFVFQDPYLSVESELQGTRIVKNGAVLYKPCEEIAKETLDPSLVTLENLLESGVTIDPATTMHLLDVSDPSELEARASQMSENLYQHLVDNDLIKVEK